MQTEPKQSSWAITWMRIQNLETMADIYREQGQLQEALFIERQAYELTAALIARKVQ